MGTSSAKMSLSSAFAAAAAAAAAVAATSRAASYKVTLDTPSGKQTFEEQVDAAPMVMSDAEGAAVAQHSGSANDIGISFRQNFEDQSEMHLNLQIQMELAASHTYMAMGAYFDRGDVALYGFRDWAMKNSEEEREHAMKFIKYQNLRGGRYVPMHIPEPAVTDFSSALEAMQHALKMEMMVNENLQ